MVGDEKKRQDHLEAVVEHAPDFIARLGPDLRYRYVNQAAERLTGIPREEWIGRTTAELGFAPDAIRPGTRALEEALETGERQEVVAAAELEGRTVWLEMRVVPEQGASGEVEGLVFVSRDITERRQAFQRLREARQLLGRTLDSLSEAVFVVEERGRRIRTCNAAAVTMFGWSRDELLGRSSSWLHVDEAAFRRFGELSRIELDRGRPFRTRFTMRRKDGTVFPTEHTVSLLHPERGLEAGAVSVVRDRTREVEAEEDLRHYNQRLRALRQMDRAILAAGSRTEMARAAVDHAQEIVGCERASVSLIEGAEDVVRLVAVRSRQPGGPAEGTRLTDCPFPLDELRRGKLGRIEDVHDIPEPRPAVLEALSDTGIRSVLSVPLGSGKELGGALSLSFAEPGSPDGRVEEVAREMADHLALGLRQFRLEEAVRDEVRDRLEAEQRAQALQVGLEELLNDLEVGYLRVDLDGTIRVWNAAALDILRFDPGTVLAGRSVEDVLWHGESWKGVLDRIRDDSAPRTPVQVRIRRSDGTAGWVSALARVMHLPGDEPLAEGVFQDVTEEMRLREEVVGISSRERLRLGQDLHDDLGQHLTGLAFLARDLGQRLVEEGHQGAAADARELEGMANLAVKKTRHLARGVQPPSLEGRGLPRALEELARDAEDIFGLTVEMELVEAPETVSLEEASHLYRIAQEAITNAARHGGAATVSLSWRGDETGRELRIADDGTGFPPDDEDGHRGLGMRIMRYRAHLLGGTLEVRSGAGEGTRVRVTLPPASVSARWHRTEEDR